MTTNSPKQLYYLTGNIKHIRQDISHFDDIAYCSESRLRSIYAYICISKCMSTCACKYGWLWGLRVYWGSTVSPSGSQPWRAESRSTSDAFKPLVDDTLFWLLLFNEQTSLHHVFIKLSAMSQLLHFWCQERRNSGGCQTVD